MCMTVRKEATLPNVKLCGESLTWVDKVKHLGNTIRADLKENDEMTNKRRPDQQGEQYQCHVPQST